MSTKQPNLTVDEMLVRAEGAIAEAHKAAATAVEGFLKTAEFEKRSGLVLDTCGYARMTLHHPSHQLREALKRLDLIEMQSPNCWGVWGFRDCTKGTPASQSINAHEIAYHAAVTVLNRELAGHGKFYFNSYMD